MLKSRIHEVAMLCPTCNKHIYHHHDTNRYECKDCNIFYPLDDVMKFKMKCR